MDVFKEIEKLDLPKRRFVVLGGASLAVRGIRDTDDLDIVVDQDVFDTLKDRGWKVDEKFKEDWERERLLRGPAEIYTNVYISDGDYFISAEEMIENSDLINGVYFQSLEHILFCKRDNGRDKDLKDIDHIEEHLSGDSINS